MVEWLVGCSIVILNLFQDILACLLFVFKPVSNSSDILPGDAETSYQ